MSTKFSWIILALLLLAVMFVPLIPNDSGIDCVGDGVSCEDISSYSSVYSKFFE